MNPRQTVDHRDVKRLAIILRDRGHSYEQSRYLIMEASKTMGLKSPKSTKRSMDRLNRDESELLTVTVLVPIMLAAFF